MSEYLDIIEAKAVATIRKNAPTSAPYYLAFSGGKDSVVLEHLAKVSGCNYEMHYSMTSVDPPEVLQFIRREYPQCIRHKPAKTMRDIIIEKKMLPSRRIRFCCQYLKETGGEGRVCLVGIRREESQQRASREMIEVVGKKLNIHPIIEWDSSDIWGYIKYKNIKTCKLYKEGFKRLGCVGCPMLCRKERQKQFERWPQFKRAYMSAIINIFERRNDNFTSPEEMFEWWLDQ